METNELTNPINQPSEVLENGQTKSKETNSTPDTKDNIENINIWDTNLNNKCTYLNTYEELIKYIKDNNNTELTIHDTQHPEDKQKCSLDFIANKNNIALTFTNDTHPINIIQFIDFYTPEILINSSFFNQHKERLKQDIKNIILEKIKTKPKSLHIPDMLIDDELIDLIISSENLQETNIKFDELTNESLSQEQIAKLKQAHLEVYFKGQRISSRTAIGYYSINDLKKIENIAFFNHLSDEEIENFIYLRDDVKIRFSPDIQKKDETPYLNDLKRIFNILKNHNRSYNIHITIKNRELLRQSGLLNYPNINLTINNDLYEYQKDEYLSEEKILDKIVIPIKETNLSPYEKYLAIYNIVKQFKPYKENEEDKNQSRYLRYILNNEYMVCVGYAKLLTTLLDKVGIPSMTIGASVDTSQYKNNEEDVPTKLEGHERNIVKIDDDKYNIHGYFVVDATLDNDIKHDLYHNSTSTFDKRKEARRLEKLSDEDLVLDFHNFEEYLEKINFYLRKQINQKSQFFSNSNKTYQEKVVYAYKDIYRTILNLLVKLDYSKYQELYNKYNDLIEEKTQYLKNINLKEIEDIFSDFLTDYATYIIPLSNQNVDNETILKAASNVKQEVNKYTQEELQKWQEETIIDNQKQKRISFPYTYNPDETRPNYLELSADENSHKR